MSPTSSSSRLWPITISHAIQSYWDHRSMKALLVNKFYWMKGGSEAVFFGDKALLEANGHDVVPFSMQDSKNVPSEYSDSFVSNIDYTSGKIRDKITSAARIVFSMEARKKMRQLVQKTSPDVAHFHIFQHQISPSVFAPLRKAGIPIVLTLHDLKPICPNYKMFTHGEVCERCKGRKFYNCVKHKCTKGSTGKSLVNMVEMYFHYFAGYYQNVDRYVAVSRFYQRKMIEFGFSEDQVVYIPNYIDCEDFAPSGSDDDYALYFGRLSEEKGLETLLEAAKLQPDIRILIAGTGPAEDALKQLAASLNLDNVEFVGFQTGEAMRNLLDRASFTVLPSKWYENCPMSVLESLAMEKPVVGANIGGIPDLIADGVDGFLYDNRSPADLAEKMDRLWQDKALRRTFGQTGRSKVAAEFNPQKHYDQLIALYQDIGVGSD
ncbi:MAG TPA: glycosyltransferase family 1 protein [Chromatiaceae bacterium]|nr:glycosyltransferase family 1 protein [Chromatiaceae bacterium]HIB83255.1 glycosyltransferase family 1 protein [Chromatiaceae bacterium]HIN81615.1 glycosyltransferase family 1 protein [Chromatiales bacterium]